MDSDVGARNFEFAFDNPNFSDRVLSIEIIPDPVETQTNNGDEATRRHDAGRSRDLSSVLRVNTLHINSAILAVNSQYFYKLFSNGMRESEQRVATLRIYASEETALMELLNFMYNNTLTTAATPSTLLNILMAADKFEVTSCIRYCSQQLNKLPMTFDFALSCLDRPSSVLHADAFRHLADSAKQFISVQFKDIKKYENRVINLSLAGIETILLSDDIQVPSEDIVYDLVLKWAELHYPQLEERRGILETRLRHLIRFPYMTNQKLKEVLTDTNFSPEVASEIVLEALFFKNEIPYRKRQHASGRHVAGETILNTDRSFVKRAYMYRPVQAIEREFPHHHCVVYLDLKREECVRLFPFGSTISEPFHLGQRSFFLSAYCNLERENQPTSQCFGLFLGMRENGSASCEVDYEFSALSMGKEDYTRKPKLSNTFKGGDGSWGMNNLFETTWAAFIADGSPFFINDILHLKVVVTIK